MPSGGVPALGEYVIPSILSGGKTLMYWAPHRGKVVRWYPRPSFLVPELRSRRRAGDMPPPASLRPPPARPRRGPLLPCPPRPNLTLRPARFIHPLAHPPPSLPSPLRPPRLYTTLPKTRARKPREHPPSRPLRPPPPPPPAPPKPIPYRTLLPLPPPTLPPRYPSLLPPPGQCHW